MSLDPFSRASDPRILALEHFGGLWFMVYLGFGVYGSGSKLVPGRLAFGVLCLCVCVYMRLLSGAALAQALNDFLF